ncbi:MAG: hypothetical protein JETT_2611 [Candidatus Jettenia ecosi]|uniref:Uncharacterized protein n=1 Tax=Candidatus Jettenia ecosi TaxID=2494326 RepID=A0A533Q919_9BACT|nr:MAG: hypothetical protein JETT_2611 [Candidatus Jettenia ecosi]
MSLSGIQAWGRKHQRDWIPTYVGMTNVKNVKQGMTENTGDGRKIGW